LFLKKEIFIFILF